MSNDPYLLITADTHAGGSHEQYREYLDSHQYGHTGARYEFSQGLNPGVYT